MKTNTITDHRENENKIDKLLITFGNREIENPNYIKFLGLLIDLKQK